MTENEELEPEGPAPSDRAEVVEPVRRSAPRGPGGNTEKALGLEMARLFGVPPRLLVSPPARPVAQSAPAGEGPAEGAGEPAGDEQAPD